MKKKGDKYGIIVEDSLLKQLILNSSDLILGKSTYNIRATLSSIPDIGSNGFSLGPKVILNTTSLKNTGR